MWLKVAELREIVERQPERVFTLQLPVLDYLPELSSRIAEGRLQGVTNVNIFLGAKRSTVF